MRLLRFYLCVQGVASFLTVATNGLPFTRGQKNSDDHDEEAYVEQDGDIITFTRHTARRNAVLEQFFSSDLDDESSSNALLKEIRHLSMNRTDFLVATRRTLHKRPELMYRESETSGLVRKILTELDIAYTTGWALNANPDIVPGTGGYGIVADIGTGGEPCVLLRADMDALPIRERTEGIEGYKSQNDGRMHACGHDGHTCEFNRCVINDDLLPEYIHSIIPSFVCVLACFACSNASWCCFCFKKYGR